MMKSLDRIPLLANVLIVACSRPNAEVGKLVKAVVTYATDGARTSLDDLRLEAYFDLIAQDLDTLRTAAETKSRKCSESAKCRTARSNSSLHNTAKKVNATISRQRAISEDAKDSPGTDISNNVDVSEESDNSRCRIDTEEPVVPGNFNSSDATFSFERIKDVYGKTGVNESRALGVWQQLSEDERMAAFAHVQRLQGDLSSRSYLYVYLRDKEWTKEVSPDKP
jgi:hypothetical protein